MAGSESFANRTLWHFISGTGVLRPKELIARELKKNEAKILEGLLYYKKQVSPSGEQLKAINVTGVQKDFLQKLSVFLGLEELQCYQLFCSYLVYDYRGTQKNLQQLLSNERHSHTLMLKVRDYYYTERLYLLHIMKRILSLWPDPEYPYKKQYSEFVNALILNDKLIKKVLEQLQTLCGLNLPTWETNGPLMNERQALLWVQQNLKEQCELLQMLFVYYKDFETDLDGMIDLVERFKRHGFGKHQVYKHVLEESSEKLLRRICYLEVLVLLQLLDIENIYRSTKEGSFADHIFLKDKTSFQRLDKVMQTLGGDVAHGPILLSWAVIRQIYLEDEDFGTTRKFGNMALQLNIFEFLSQMLETEPFCGKTTVASFSHYVVYTTLFTTLTAFDETTLGGHRDSEFLYEVSAKLLKKEFVATDFWQKGMEEGLGTLFHSALEWFPLDFSTLLQLSAAIAAGSKESAKKMMAIWKRLPRYTEYLDRNSSQDLIQTTEAAVWQLAKDKLPYIIGEFRIPTGVYGQTIHTSDRYVKTDTQESPVIQWEFAFNGWQLLECEVEELLHQISQGSGKVTLAQVARVSAIADLVKSLLTSDLEMVDQMNSITTLLYQIIHRFAGLKPAPLDLLATCMECLTCVAQKHPKQVWHSMKQTGLLPYLTENVDNMAEVLSGQGLSAGLYGVLLAGSECTQGRYPLTTAFLDFVSCLIKPMFLSGKENDLMACVMFMLREVFPAFQKWRYYNMNRREVIGQKCLDNFHNILNFMATKKKGFSSKSPQLQDVVVYSLLFTEAGRSLLEIIATGVDAVEQALAQQGSTFEGSGVETIQMIQLAFSVLNRLLLLKSPELPISPVENALASQPAGRQHQHVVATISQYIYHRHNPRLPTLATLLLKRLALVLPMSILACLGSDAESIRDMYLTRLQAVTEDLRLKMVILELLSVCVEAQPGLIEIFLNVKPAESGDGKKDLSLGKTSCLQTVLNLMDSRKQGTYQCPPDLLCACTDFIHSLWSGLRETAMSVLRNRETFWPSICAPLGRELCKLGDDDEKVLILPYEIKTVAHVLKILAQEIYSVADLKLDSQLKAALQNINRDNRIKYWSGYVNDCLKAEGEIQELLEENMADSPTLQLLVSWKNFLVTVTALKIEEIKLDSDLRELILIDLLEGIQAQFVGTQTSLNIKLASVASALLFTLIKHWTGSACNWTTVLKLIHTAVRQSCSSCETLIPSMHIGLLGSILAVLQNTRQSSSASTVSMETVRAIIPTVCSVLLQSTRQLPTPKDLQNSSATQSQALADQSMIDPRLKLQTVTCGLLVELIKFVNNPEVWLSALQEHAILQTLLVSAELFLKGRQGLHYVHTLFLLFLTIASSEKGAEALAVSGLTQHTCLPVTCLYQNGDLITLTGAPVIPSKKLSDCSVTWHAVFCLCIELYNTVLITLRYYFLEDMLNFVGTHQERLLQSLEIARLGLFETALKEAEQTCALIERLSHFNREWRLALPDTVSRLLMSMLYMCQTFISLLIRPRYLQLILEHHSGQKQPGKGRDSSSPIPPILQHQTSTEDIDQPTTQLIDVQHSMLRIVCQSFSALKCFTPDLCEILLDQNMDLSEYEPFLAIGFSTPSVDQDIQPTFGTMLSCVNVCIRLLQKMETRVASPHRSPDSSTVQQIPKSLVLFVLETSLYIIMSQAMRFLRDANLSPRDKPLLKRELGAEMNSFLSGIHRFFRRGGPTSPGSTTLLPSPGGPSPSTSILGRTTSQTTFTTNQEQAFFKIVQEFVKQILR